MSENALKPIENFHLPDWLLRLLGDPDFENKLNQMAKLCYILQKLDVGTGLRIKKLPGVGVTVSIDDTIVSTADEKVKVSGNDAVAGWLRTADTLVQGWHKVIGDNEEDFDTGSTTAGTGWIEAEELNDGFDEQLKIKHVGPLDPGAGIVGYGSPEDGEDTALTDSLTLDGTAGTFLWVVTRLGYDDAGDEKLYAYHRKLTFDAKGHLYAISAETRVEIDAPDDC